jgi:Domain of unknown function (DUF4345)
MEKRLLQAAIVVLAWIPVIAGGAGMVLGPAMLGGDGLGASVTADSHFRYLSGLLFAIGLAYWSCVKGIERRGSRITLLTLIVISGGIGRAIGWISAGPPSRFHIAALGVELLLVPAVWLWQRRVAAGAGRGEAV